MAMAPYHHTYKRLRPGDEGQPAESTSPVACTLTDQGAEPRPADLAWCICHAWRVIYYTYRRAARLPLWDGVDDFEILMADVLLRLSSGFEPIAPMPTSPHATPQCRSDDPRAARVSQPSSRVYPHPLFHRRTWRD